MGKNHIPRKKKKAWKDWILEGCERGIFLSTVNHCITSSWRTWDAQSNFKTICGQKSTIEMASKYIYWSAFAWLSQLCLFLPLQWAWIYPSVETWFFLLADLELAEAWHVKRNILLFSVFWLHPTYILDEEGRPSLSFLFSQDQKIIWKKFH